MKRLITVTLVLLALATQDAFARTATRTAPPERSLPESGPLAFPVATAKSAVDTTYLLGGPDRWDGSFETPGGAPDWHGWTSEDLSLGDGENHWHVSTYWAEYIEGHGIGNHALYCGDETIPACAPPDTIGGVGPDWRDDVEWRYSVADTTQPVTVRLTGLMNYDLPDAGWDFLELYIKRGSGAELLDTWTGSSDTTVALDFVTVISPGEYSGPDRDEVRLFWRVWTSADGWDDVDCINPSHGACQIDDLSVYLDGQLITFDDFEPGSTVNWNVASFSGVGDFANLRNDLGDIDPCRDNYTWQVNFVDDGVVVPGTGGTPCEQYCYDPGLWIVNNTGGLLVDEGDWFLKNQVVSPPIAWPAGHDGAELAFDVYRHETLAGDSPGIFYYWQVRSTDSSDPADLELAPWATTEFLLDGGPEFLRHEEPIGHMLVPDRQWVQVALVADEAGWLWGWDGTNGTPAPYFDNAAVKAWDPDGPEIRVKGEDLFADIFPEAETLNPNDLAANWCRVDVQAITNTVQPRNILGDSLEVEVVPLRHGATVPEPASLHWVLDCNPTFDPVRTESPDGQGLLRGMVTGGEVLDYWGNPRENVWSFDLPDTGFFFPGDVLHYYITASDDLAGDVRTSVWPPDTTGVLDFTLETSFPAELTARALPTLTQPEPGQFASPDLLFCDITEDSEAAAVWYAALQELGYVPGGTFDVMTLHKGDAPHGLESQSTLAHISVYESLLVSSGAGDHIALSGNSWSDDAGLIMDWLDLGEKQALLAGDFLCFGLDRSSDALLARLGVAYYGPDLAYYLFGARDLQATPAPLNGVLPEETVWEVYGDCPDIRYFDVLRATGDGQFSASLDPSGSPGGTFAALVTVDDPVLVNRTAVMPFDLTAVTGMSGVPGSDEAPARANLLNYLLFWLGAEGASSADEIPGVGKIAVSAHPNPFNPQTTIAFDLPRSMEVSLDIFDLQGRLVRRLLDENPFTAGGHKRVWDGRNGEGGATASGVYFYRFTAGDQLRVGKLTLLK